MKSCPGGILIWHFMLGQFLTFDPWKVWKGLWNSFFSLFGREVVSFEEVARSLISAFFGCKQILTVSPNICWALIWSDEVCFFSNAWNWSFHCERPLARKDWKVMNTPWMMKMKFTSKDRNICCTKHHQITFQSILAFFCFHMIILDESLNQVMFFVCTPCFHKKFWRHDWWDQSNGRVCGNNHVHGGQAGLEGVRSNGKNLWTRVYAQTNHWYEARAV